MRIKQKPGRCEGTLAITSLHVHVSYCMCTCVYQCILCIYSKCYGHNILKWLTSPYLKLIYTCDCISKYWHLCHTQRCSQCPFCPSLGRGCDNSTKEQPSGAICKRLWEGWAPTFGSGILVTELRWGREKITMIQIDPEKRNGTDEQHS